MTVVHALLNNNAEIIIIIIIIIMIEIQYCRLKEVQVIVYKDHVHNPSEKYNFITKTNTSIGQRLIHC